MSSEELELQFGISTLPSEEFLSEYGIVDESELTVHCILDGGKGRKKKKKKYTTPKVIKHKHLKRPKALLEYFSVDDTGKVKRLKQESPEAAGAYMADHQDRYTCGKTGKMYWKLTSSGERLPHPQQKHKAKTAVVVVKKVVKKKK
jgi:small subunit ribosomal protein S27Ae